MSAKINVLTAFRPYSSEEFVGAANELRARGARSILLLAAVQNDTASALQDFATSVDLPVFGGMVSAVIDGDESSLDGHVLVGWPDEVAIAVVEGISNVSVDIGAALDASLSPLGPGDEERTAFVFLDGRANRIRDCIAAVYDRLGCNVTIVGGGVGVPLRPETACVLTPAGMLRDAMVVAVVASGARSQAAHGYSENGRPLTATATSGNVVREIDFRSAEEAYRFSLGPDRDGVADFAPIGIRRLDGSLMVRDVLDVRDGNVLCVGEVPPFAHLVPLSWTPDDLIEAAMGVVGTVVAQGTGPVLVFDCVSRARDLGARFADELRGLRASASGRRVVGGLTFGEVYGPVGQLPTFLNKTVVACVVGLLDE